MESPFQKDRFVKQNINKFDVDLEGGQSGQKNESKQYIYSKEKINEF